MCYYLVAKYLMQVVLRNPDISKESQACLRRSKYGYGGISISEEVSVWRRKSSEDCGVLSISKEV